jgi:excisionase family DNA binding protein
MSRNQRSKNPKKSEAPVPSQRELGHIQRCLRVLLGAVEHEINRSLTRIREHEARILEALAKVTLLSREEAAERLGVSMASFDRMVTSGKIEATYLDARPRFRLPEIERLIEANTAPARKHHQ